MRIPEGYVVTDEHGRLVPRVVGNIELLRPRRYIIHFNGFMGSGYRIVGKIKMIRMLARHWKYYGRTE